MSERSDARGLLQLGSHLGAVVALGAAVWLAGDRWQLVLPLQLALGVVVVFLFCPVHEAVHRTPFRAAWLNEAVGTALGFVVFLPFRWFRLFHFEHHRRTHVEGRDPELAEAKPATRAALLFYLTGLKSFWWSSLKTLTSHAAGRVDDPFMPDDGREKAACARQARCYLAGYGLIAVAAAWAESWAPVTYWIAPMALSAWSLRLYLLAEHTLLPHGPDMLENTRTMRTDAFVRWLAWRMPYHVEHHVFPSIPFHALHRAHDAIAPRHGHPISGYRSFFREYWAATGRSR